RYQTAKCLTGKIFDFDLYICTKDIHFVIGKWKPPPENLNILFISKISILIKFYIEKYHNSERNDECIDFTMLCVFFFLCTRERVEIMLQFQTVGMVSCSKMNLVGALGRSFFEFPNSFQKRRGKKKKKN
ncbi:Uncharacterized protein FWK35_00002390, partial [Aphis craccivora]